MAFMRIDDYYCLKDYIHPHINNCIDHYRNKDLIHLPAYRGFDAVNRNGTWKLVGYRRGKQCICAIDKGYLRKTKPKYRINDIYFTWYMSQYGLQSLVKIKGKTL